MSWLTNDELQHADLGVAFLTPTRHGNRLATNELRRVLRDVCRDPSRVHHYTLDIDGSDHVLPSLGTLAKLNPFTYSPRPLLIACTLKQEHAFPISIVLAAVHDGILNESLRCSGKDTVCGHHATPSLLAYVRRRMGSIMQKPARGRWPVQRWYITLQFATEAATHFVFLFSFLLLVGTPIHKHYGRGSYCSAFRELMRCAYGNVQGFDFDRVFLALIASFYSGTLR